MLKLEDHAGIKPVDGGLRDRCRLSLALISWSILVWVAGFEPALEASKAPRLPDCHIPRSVRDASRNLRNRTATVSGLSTKCTKLMLFATNKYNFLARTYITERPSCQDSNPELKFRRLV